MADTNDYSAHYREQYQHESFEKVLVGIRRREVIASVAAYRRGRVVEVGCGLEPLFPFIGDFGTFTVIEPVPEFAEAAREQASDDPRIVVREGFIEDIAADIAKEGAPDLVIVSSLLHEVANPTSLLHAIRELCGAGTVAHFNVPNIRSFHRLLAVEMGIIPTVFTQSDLEARFDRRTQYDAASLAATVTEAGFHVLDSGSYFIKPFTHDQMQRLLAHGIIDTKAIEGLRGMARHIPALGAEIYVNVARADMD